MFQACQTTSKLLWPLSMMPLVSSLLSKHNLDGWRTLTIIWNSQLSHQMKKEPWKKTTGHPWLRRPHIQHSWSSKYAKFGATLHSDCFVFPLLWGHSTKAMIPASTSLLTSFQYLWYKVSNVCDMGSNPMVSLLQFPLKMEQPEILSPFLLLLRLFNLAPPATKRAFFPFSFSTLGPISMCSDIRDQLSQVLLVLVSHPAYIQINLACEEYYQVTV